MNSNAVYSPSATSYTEDDASDAHSSEFYISRHGKSHGPCTLDEIRNYLAYGSMQPSERVCRAGSADWIPVGELPELRPADPEPEVFDRAPRWLQWLRPVVRFLDKGTVSKTTNPIAPRRRVVRYRDYEKVPEAHRAGATAAKIFWGFIFFPPRLWSACATVFTQRIYRNSIDTAGYLKTWPRWVEMFCAVLVAVNAVAWLLAIYWMVDTAFPTAKIALEDFFKIAREWWAELGTHPNA